MLYIISFYPSYPAKGCHGILDYGFRVTVLHMRINPMYVPREGLVEATMSYKMSRACIMLGYWLI